MYINVLFEESELQVLYVCVSDSSSCCGWKRIASSTFCRVLVHGAL